MNKKIIVYTQYTKVFNPCIFYESFREAALY